MDVQTIRRLFVAALDLTPNERCALVEKECASAAERKAVLDLLSFDQGDGESNTIGGPISGLRREAVTGRFGPYEILEIIGRGGMGAVYRAERVDGEVRQVVAIKILDREWLDRKTLDRFRRERQILSGLAHPNITRLLDTGTREDGRPYLVMEFIGGEPLDEYCRQRNLGQRDRLRLFLPICRAVQYAHSKLVIHRDLKPSNILVTAEGEPKLLDFGIASALDEAAPQATNSLLLTPDYASPDLARGEAPSTAMDVYGLGALLYFLLTGSAPHRVEGLSPIELVRHLSEIEPQPPAEIRAELKGDLENIIRQAMHVDPQRRYGSARELADDIESYLALRPVRATPDRLLYRASRLVVRRRWLVTAASVALIVVSTGAFFVWAERRRADEEAATARAVSEFLQMDLIAQAGLRSQIERGAKADPDLKVRTILDRASVSVHDKFPGMPKVEAAIRMAIGGAYQDLGLESEALKHYQRAFELRVAASGRTSRDSTAAAIRLGETQAAVGKLDDAQKVFREMIASADRSREGRRTAARARYRLAMIASSGKRRDALPMLEQAIAEMHGVEGSEHETVLTALNQLAVLHLDMGNASRAEPLFREILATRTRVLGPLHPDTIGSMSELGMFCYRQSRFPEAEEHLTRAAQDMESVLGPEHPVTLSTLNNLTNVYSRHGLYAKSAAIRLRIFNGYLKVPGPDHPSTLITMSNLANAYRSSGRFAEAIKLQAQALEKKRGVHGAEHPSTLASMRALAATYREANRLTDSVRLGAEALDISQRVFGNHLDTASAMMELGRTKKEQGAFREAEQLLQDALRLRYKLAGPNNQITLLSRSDLAGVLQAISRFAEAENMFREAIAGQRKLLGDSHPQTLSSMSDLASLYRQTRRLDESLALQLSVLEARRKTLGPEHPNTLRTMRDLSSTYRHQKRYADAEPLIASLLRTVVQLESGGETILGLSAADLRRELTQLVRTRR